MNLDRALRLARITLREPTTFLPAHHELRHFLQWFVDTLGVEQGCGAIEPAIGESSGQPAVLIPDEMAGVYTPEETLGAVGQLIRAVEKAKGAQ